MRKAFAYLRVSTEGQVDKDGFIRQKAAIESYARSHDIEIVRFFEEKGVSGTEYKRPALTELMSELLSDGIHLVLIGPVLARENFSGIFRIGCATSLLAKSVSRNSSRVLLRIWSVARRKRPAIPNGGASFRYP